MLCTSKIREKVQFLSIILCPLSAEHSVTLPRVWWLCNEGFYYNTHCTVGGFAVGTLTLQILSFGTIKALVLMLHSPHFFPKYFAFFLKTLKYCNRRNVTRIIGKSSTGDEITAAIWYITDVCSTDFFFSFEFSYPSSGQTQTLCLAYEIWQLYSPGLDDYRLVFFLEFIEAPGE